MMFKLHDNDCKVKFHNNKYEVEFNKHDALSPLLFLFPVPPSCLVHSVKYYQTFK